MNQYVLSYARPINQRFPSELVLIEKKKPAWQLGKLNLPGGKIENGETAEQAACRELLEETGIEASEVDSKFIGNLFGRDWIVTVVECPYRPGQTPQSITDEEVVKLDYLTALQDPRLIENLKVILPLCMANVKGWRMDDYCWQNRYEVHF